MTEILYIQAGSQANYVGTHFWNTQETYLAFEDPEHSFIHHDVSFIEVMKGSMGSSTYCPRAILFDRKSNFGSLTKNNAVGNEDFDNTTDFDILWSGNVHEVRQNTVSKSKYHARLEETDDLRVADMDENGSHLLQDSHEIRYWSDFSRVYYIPKSIQPLPEPTYGEMVSGDWRGGHELFHRCNEDTSLLDESVRPFLEECDHFQGLHVLNDVETFGGFTDAFLTTFRDEFSNAPSLVIPILSSVRYDPYDAQVTMSVLNEALYLRSLREMSSMVLPIHTSTWPSHSWSHLLNFDKQKIYHTSALISTHLETSTLPIRLNRSRQNLSSFCAQARRYGVDVFCGLSGCSPVIPSTAFDRKQFSFSDNAPLTSSQQWSCMDVTRGFQPLILSKYDEWRSESMHKGVAISNINAPAYPLPSSYPFIFHESDLVDSPYKGKDAPPAVALSSSIYTSSATAKIFSTYAQYLKTAQRYGILDASVGLETDEVRELIDDLWALHDGYSATGGDVDGEVG